MADNLKIIEQNIEAALDENGAPESVKVVNHKAVLLEVLNAAGKYTGLFFNAKGATDNLAPIGTFLWNGNAPNTLTDFVVRMSQLTADGNNVGTILDQLSANAVIHFKDKVGRSFFLLYQSHVAAQDPNTDDVYDVTVRGIASNSNYVYQAAEVEVCGISFYNSGGQDGFVDLTTEQDINGLKKFLNDYTQIRSLGLPILSSSGGISGTIARFGYVVNDSFTSKTGFFFNPVQNTGNNNQPFVIEAALTQARSYTFPDKSGTVALLDDIPSGGGAAKYNQSFVVADWVSNQITILAATHGLGTKPIIQVFDSSGDEVIIDKNRNASGDVTLTVIPGQEFDGDLTLI